jgi:hypothetical protein
MAGTHDSLFSNAVTKWEVKAEMSVHGIQSPLTSRQMEWDMPLIEVLRKRMLSAASDRASKASLIAAAEPYYGAYLIAHPCSSLGTRLDNSSLRISVALCLGAPVCSLHFCVCGASVQTRRRHDLGCRKSAGRLSCHNAVNNQIKRVLSPAEVPSRLEPTSLARDDNKQPWRLVSGAVDRRQMSGLGLHMPRNTGTQSSGHGCLQYRSRCNWSQRTQVHEVYQLFVIVSLRSPLLSKHSVLLAMTLCVFLWTRQTNYVCFRWAACHRIFV